VTPPSAQASSTQPKASRYRYLYTIISGLPSSDIMDAGDHSLSTHPFTMPPTSHFPISLISRSL